jgi:dTDP-4-dehydrorhamnose 3,5-epimerase
MKTTLSDVQLIPCKKIVNDRGFLQEICRQDEPSFFPIGQSYLTQTKMGIIKAWYLHKTQWDSIFVINGTMKMALYDDRPDSPTYQQAEAYIIKDSDPHIIRIPPGVWHGFQAVDSNLLLLHMNSHAFDFAQTDEIRKEPHTPSIPFNW